MARPVAFDGCAELVPLCAEVIRGWGFAPISGGDAEPAVIVRREGKDYLIESEWLDMPARRTTGASAVCAFLVDLVRAWLPDNPSLLCLHCAAVEFDGRLVVFPSTYGAGKSTLAARLAAEGLRIFADDVMPMTGDGAGMAPGLAPRLRLPLPGGAGPVLRRFVDDHRGPGDSRYLYLDLPAERLARHGATAPIGGFVLLDRRAEGEAELSPAPGSAVLSSLVLRNFAQPGSAEERLGRLHSLVERRPCYRLRYADVEGAVALLKERFRTWDLPLAGAPAPPAVAPAPDPAPADLRSAAVRSGTRFLRDADVLLRRVDGELFLVDPRDDSIYHLNAVGAGLWNLLEEPTSAEEAIEAIRSAFPEIAADRIGRDVTGLLARLRDSGLIAAHESSRRAVG